MKKVENSGITCLNNFLIEKYTISAAESFQGEMTRLDIWGKILTIEDINNLKKDCNPYFGDIIAWPDVHSGLRGHIKVCRGAQTSIQIPVQVDIPTKILQNLSFS